MRKYIYGPGIDEPICLIDVADANARYFYHCDGLGSVVALSDVNNVLVERYAYDVFGRPTIRDVNGTEIAAGAFANPYLFTAQAYDAETALYYYRARHYDYFTGRFLQPDPIGYADGLNLYSYVQNNPARWVDPYGLVTGVEEAAAVGTFAGWGFGGYMTAGGTFVTGTGVGALAVGTAAVAGGAGYGISKYIVCPVIDWAGEKLYNHVIHLKNKENEEYARKEAERKRLRRQARKKNIGHTGKQNYEKHSGADGHSSRKRHRRRMEGLEGMSPWIPFWLGDEDEDEKK